MAIECKNCKASITTDGDKLDLTRINALGEAGEWICRECLDELLERSPEGEPTYMHHPDCQNYCDYACNSRKGEEIAEQIAIYLKPLNDGTQRRLPPPLSNDNTKNENGGSRSLE